jgi:hypothetical protein
MWHYPALVLVTVTLQYSCSPSGCLTTGHSLRLIQVLSHMLPLAVQEVEAVPVGLAADPGRPTRSSSLRTQAGLARAVCDASGLGRAHCQWHCLYSVVLVALASKSKARAALPVAVPVGHCSACRGYDNRLGVTLAVPVYLQYTASCYSLRYSLSLLGRALQRDSDPGQPIPSRT